MGLLDDADRALSDPAEATDDADDPVPEGAVGTLERAATVDAAGETVTLERPDTQQPDESTGGWLTGTEDSHGVPRGAQAASLRNIVQTAAMQSITNAITDQLLGGELTFLDNDDVADDLGEGEQQAAEDLKTLLRDVLTGPHMGDEDLDDIVAACVEDMLGVGNAYIQFIGAENADLPVAALSTLDPLTIRHNYDEHGYPEDPPYWQAAGAFSGGSVVSVGNLDPVALDGDDVAVLRYPKGNRSYRRYPVSAAWQVREWLEILADSVTHHKRYYSDNEVPPGILQVVNATDSSMKDIKHKIEEASGDPRDFPVVGAEGPANWVEMGGTAINLDVIQEQEWFFQLCLMGLGLSKAEFGIVEDVNYSNGEVQAEMVFKKVGQPFGKQFERAFLQVARQFDTFRELGEPFTPTLANADPRAEQARKERLREEFGEGVLTLREYRRRAGDEDIAEDEDRFTVEINGTEVDYGEHPWPVAKRLLSAAGAPDPDVSPDGDDVGGE